MCCCQRPVKFTLLPRFIASEATRLILRSALAIEQARLSERPSAACRCATPSRLPTGLTIFCQKLAKCGCIQHLFRKKLLQPGVLVLELFRRLASGTSMPPYLAFQLYSVASETPCLRARSAVFAPASCSRSTQIICSSVNLARFICPSFTRPDSNSAWTKFAVAGQSARNGPIF
jgi:hypothetical protein